MKSSGSEATVARRSAEEALKEVRAALEREPRVRFDQRPIQITFNEVDDTVTLQGESPDIAAKKLALELAVAVPGVRGVVDRLRVAPGERMRDEDIRNHIRDAFIQEQAFANCAIRVQTKEVVETFNEPMEKRCDFKIIVGEGMALLVDDVQILVTTLYRVVTLDGAVRSEGEKDMAESTARFVFGVDKVINILQVV
jgi:osmotically-inducible protein OsmY